MNRRLSSCHLIPRRRKSLSPIGRKTSRAPPPGYTTTSIRRGPRFFIALSNWAANSPTDVARLASTPIPEASLTQSSSGSCRSSIETALGPGIAGADPSELDVEDRVRAVGEDQGRDVEGFSRLRPQRLQRVHAAAVALETNDFPIGTGDRGASGDGNALSDRASSQRKMIVRLDIGREPMNAAACCRAFVGNDRAARQIMRNDLPGGERIELSVRNVRVSWLRQHAPAVSAP